MNGVPMRYLRYISRNLTALSHYKTRAYRQSLNACFLCAILALFTLFSLSLSSCMSNEDSFTAGRLEKLCEASLPICQTRVTCQLDEQSYLSGVFPGAEKAMVYTPHPLTTVTIRFLLDEQSFPGTEMLVRAYQVGCVELLEERLVDVDIFARAGDDRILEFSFDLEGRGDHLIEWFADATAKYVVHIDFKQRDQ